MFINFGARLTQSPETGVFAFAHEIVSSANSNGDESVWKAESRLCSAFDSLHKRTTESPNPHKIFFGILDQFFGNPQGRTVRGR
jgi:hypothetical protein